MNAISAISPAAPLAGNARRASTRTEPEQELSPRAASIAALPFVRDMEVPDEFGRRRRFWAPAVHPPRSNRGKDIVARAISDNNLGDLYARALVEHIQVHDDPDMLTTVVRAIMERSDADREAHILIGFFARLGRGLLCSTFMPRAEAPIAGGSA